MDRLTHYMSLVMVNIVTDRRGQMWIANSKHRYNEMKIRTDCFLPCDNLQTAETMIGQLRDSRMVNRIYLLVSGKFAADNSVPDDCSYIITDNVCSSYTMRAIAEHTDADYALLSLKSTELTFGMYAIERLMRIAAETDAAMVYSDRYSVENGVTVNHPVTDYQTGSVRDDFDFGSLVLINARLICRFADTHNGTYKYAGWYCLRLFLSRHGNLFHINEYLYTEEERDLRASGAKQFDYVNPRNRDVQIEMEHVATEHLRTIGALIDTSSYRVPDFGEQDFDREASVIIPVRNREKTIADAVRSALSQKTDFPFNVIVVDNHSTDGTTELLEQLCAETKGKGEQDGGTPQLIHIIPQRTDLGIGGCWNVAVNDSRCGRFAVQLDSDDIYSSPLTLQRIVEAFYNQKAAMVVGSYRMCDFDLNTLPPGLIDHREWTDDNGCNNALRINGLGAPRAFFTPLLRQIQFPNTSYGEDYALGLAFSRKYKIGRIYDELYLCRRWAGNSDAALSVEKVNANNVYKDRLRTMEIAVRQRINKGCGDGQTDSSLTRFFDRQMATWPEAGKRFRELQNVQTREPEQDEDSSMDLKLQFNPARMVSTGAKIDKRTIDRRPCFLCEKNRPKEQMVKSIDRDFDLLVNPFPILPEHFTIPANTHRPQLIAGYYGEIWHILDTYPELTVFYNGPECGASAPDHMHFQAGTSGILPLQTSWQWLSRDLTEIISEGENGSISLINDWHCPALLIRSNTETIAERMFNTVYDALPYSSEHPEPMMNIVAWRAEGEVLTVIFPRRRHRPECYSATNGNQRIVSPGALDMAGLIITPRKEDFDNMTAHEVKEILREVSLGKEEMEAVTRRIKDSHHDKEEIRVVTKDIEEPEVNVGIISTKKICFSLNGLYTAKDETVKGEQTVEFSEGGILWRGNQYRELRFVPAHTDSSFSLNDVTIGVNFHWERKEKQTFRGELILVVEADRICAINKLPVEDYLTSVISSEMKATSSPEFLKAHAVISRSWLLAQMDRRKQQTAGGNGFFSFIKKDDEMIRWYDRDDHTIFDVCADDHCQRYQGITKATNKHVEEAVRATRGQILMTGGEICDARFSKCCGGITEEYRYCWEDKDIPYLVSVKDNADDMEGGHGNNVDTMDEEDFEKWICSEPEAFCNTSDKKILSQVLNDYDQETADFYRWQVEYTQEEIAGLISNRLRNDIGGIVDLIPVERGRSGRISRLRVVGTERTFTIGKELEIRRALSTSHLYSSAFVVEKHDIKAGLPQRFVLKGAGWGHGVGLCQIGAAVMGEQGYKYDSILLHYYKGAEITKIYR